jgi:tRNA-dihydrouridine synthase
MINRDTAFKIVEEMAHAVKIPISVKTRLWWENPELLVEFVTGLQNAWANLISVHGRTYKQAFTGKADFAWIYNLKQYINIPVICNGDVENYEDGMRKIIHPGNRTYDIFPSDSLSRSTQDSTMKNLDGFMIGRASFGNPWCFLPWNYKPTLDEILNTMELHGKLLWEAKERKWMMEARKHLVQYLHGFPGVKEYRTRLVHVESVDDIIDVIATIRENHPTLLNEKISSQNPLSSEITWDGCPVD